MTAVPITIDLVTKIVYKMRNIYLIIHIYFDYFYLYPIRRNIDIPEFSKYLKYLLSTMLYDLQILSQKLNEYYGCLIVFVVFLIIIVLS